MGVRLIVEALDSAPAGLNAAQRLLLVALCESARDSTRVAMPGQEELLHRCPGTASTLKRNLEALVEHGAIERVVFGHNRDGEPVYACRGRRAEYRILPFASELAVDELLAAADEAPERGPAVGPFDGGGDTPNAPLSLVDNPVDSRGDAAGKGPSSGPLREEKGAHSWTERGPSMERKGPTGGPPIPHSPHTPQIRAGEISTVVAGLRSRTGTEIDRDHAERVARQILDAAPYRVRDARKYLAGAITRDDRPERFLPTPTPPRYQRHA